MLGFTAYLKSWESWFWMERFFVFPYEFGAVLAAVGLFWLLPRRFGRRALPAAWALAVVALLALQLEWAPILSMYDATRPTWSAAVVAGRGLGEIHARPDFRNANVAVPDGDPDVTYTLARYGGLDGKYLVSELYDPFYYLPAGYSYRDHPEPAGTLMRCWLTKADVKLLVIDSDNENYKGFVRDHPEWFQQVGSGLAHSWDVEAVSVPTPTGPECSDAARSATG
jgi:hypothetical protein